MGREDWNLGFSHKEDQTMPLNYKALGRDDINSNKRKCYIKLIIKHKTNKKSVVYAYHILNQLEI